MPKELNTDETQSFSSAWAFNVDPVHFWAYWDKAFSEDECQQIIDIGTKKALKTAGVSGDAIGVRESEITWLYPDQDTEWVYRRMTDIVTNLNDRFFKFDLFGASEGFQFTKYAAPGGKYGRHVDSAYGTAIRKLSFTLQLSPPEDYEGGNLNLYTTEQPEVMNRSQGFVVVFPSYVLHEVTPVTRGTRYSLVSWITGKPFK